MGGRRLALASLVVSTLIGAAAAGAEDKPGFFESLIDRAKKEMSPDQPKPSEPKPSEPKEIKKVSKQASVVFDKKCEAIVQPYTLTDNLTALGSFTVKEGFGSLTDRAFSGRGGGRADAIGESTKLAANQLNWLPMAVEVEYGERVHADVLDDVLPPGGTLGKKHYPTARGMLQEVLAKIWQKHDYDFKLFILKNFTRNAVARPGGFLYLDQGLVDTQAVRGKAYFALAHEIAHVLQRHETKELQSMVVDSVPSKGELVKMVSGATKDPRAVLARVKAKKNLFTRHHIDQELQADSCAAKLLGRVFGDTQRLAESLNAFLRDLPPSESGKPRPAAQSQGQAFVQTTTDIVDSPVRRHPTSEERVRNLRTIYQELVREKASSR